MARSLGLHGDEEEREEVHPDHGLHQGAQGGVRTCRMRIEGCKFYFLNDTVHPMNHYVNNLYKIVLNNVHVIL